ncbi:Mak10-domain-containing protein [Teratosphaeria nubilosa]|uniref:Mak10-domain-containing protein n=1 Tax=Teratosphaeria nubilosa TaxID=161662 RepID=A0A6G1LFH2_9PEZI|nr:Mak10-domain-containing protein [Teratosphaeria nubilosa]
MSMGQRGTRDVTSEFTAAAQQLLPGQLIKDDFFTLFEAVGAIEIMDAKMDSGCVPPDHTFEPEFDVCRGLEAKEVLWIMDELMCLEIAWHDGYPLSQTVFTSLHVDRLLSPDNRRPYTFDFGEKDMRRPALENKLVHNVLRAFCIAVIKSCQLVLQTIQSQHFYEEEDFVTHLFGRELLLGLGSGEAVRLLDEALQWLVVSELDERLRMALEQRLIFRRTYLATLADDDNQWAEILGILQGVNDCRHRHLSRPLREAFSDKVQRQLATSTPPRPMLQVSWNDAYKKWTKLCKDVVAANNLTSFWICQSPNCLQRATWAFAYREPQPNAFARAYMQNILLGSDRLTENVSQIDLLLTDIRDLVLAGDPLGDPESFQIEVTSDPRHQCARVLETFMDKMFEEYLNLYRIVCQNRCRIRRLFTQSITILDGAEAETVKVDEELQRIVQTKAPNRGGSTAVDSSPISSWAKFHKLRVMAWSVQLGFETDIYLPDELCTSYWLLSVIMHKQCALIEHIERCLVERMRVTTQKGNVRYTAETLDSQAWLQCLRDQANVTRLIALALWRLTAMLMTVGAIQPPPRDYAQEELLYDARMKPFLSIIRDPIPSLEDMKRAQTEVKDVESSCKSIDADVKEAKQCLAELKKVTPQKGKYVGTEQQWAKEIKQLETTSVAIAVQTSQLGRIAKKHVEEADGGLGGVIEVSVPPPGKRYHDWWAVPQVREKTA